MSVDVRQEELRRYGTRAVATAFRLIFQVSAIRGACLRSIIIVVGIWSGRSVASSRCVALILRRPETSRPSCAAVAVRCTLVCALVAAPGETRAPFCMTLPWAALDIILLRTTFQYPRAYPPLGWPASLCHVHTTLLRLAANIVMEAHPRPTDRLGSCDVVAL